MRLDDEISRVGTGDVFAAHVYTRDTASNAIEANVPGPGSGSMHVGFAFDATLLAIVEAGDYTPFSENENVTWRGDTYVIGRVALRMKHGQPHHYSLTLEQP